MTRRIFVVLRKGEVVVEEEDQMVLALMRKHGCNVMTVVDMGGIASSAISAVEALSGGMAGPGGRVPRKKMSPEERKSRRKELRVAKKQGENG